MKLKVKEGYKKIKNFIDCVDRWHLEWFGILLLGILMAPILYLGEGCVFDFHDQLDETLLSYVFAARYPGAEVYEQMMNGLPATGLKPSAVLFIPLYSILPVWWAFIVQYAVVTAAAFFGMYASVKKVTGSSIIAFLCGAAFSMLPTRPVYGLSVVGLPLCFYCILKIRDCLEQKKVFPGIVLPAAGLVFFALSSNLVLVGYAILVVLSLVWLIRLITKKKNELSLLVAIGILGGVYTLTNLDLIQQVFHEAAYISHREDSVIIGVGFLESILQILKEGGSLHTYSYHLFIYIPVVISFIILILTYKKDQDNKKYLKILIAFLLFIAVDVLQYAFFKSSMVADIRNNMGGMLKTFQFERFCWMLPAVWHLLNGVCLAVLWKNIRKKDHILGLFVVVALYLPTLLYIAKNSTFYQNISQIRTGNFLTWENAYSEDVMEQIENHIGRDMSEYKVACLGMCPVVPLMHGFYTIDGYSNNYPLEYKQEFREIIAKDIELNRSIETYYDDWGSRAYLLHSGWGTSYMLSKYANASVSELNFDFDKMREMGCEYLFSAALITDAEAYDLSFEGCFDSYSGWWRVWVYKL